MIVGTDIEADPCRPTVGQQGLGLCDLTGSITQFGGGGVSKKDGASGVDSAFMLEPLLSNPKQLFLTLHVKRHTRVIAGMNEANVVEDNLCGEVVKPHEIIQHGLLCLP